MRTYRDENARKGISRRTKPGLLTSSAAVLALAVIAVWTPAFSAGATVIAFDFDTGSPVLSEGMNTPLDQTSGGVTAHFSSPSDPAAFSVQSYGTTFLTLSQFSGKYLYDNKATRDYLDIKFSAQLTSVNLTFATIEAHGGPGTEPCFVTLTAYMDSTANPPVGSASARGTWSNDSYPQGTLTFSSVSKPFNLVRIYLPYQLPGVTDFLVDNVVVTAGSPPPPGNLKAALVGHRAWPNYHHLDISHRGSTQTFFGKVANVGPGPVPAKVVFRVFDATTGILKATVESNAATVSIGGIVVVSGTWTASVGSYSVTAQCWFDTNNDGTFDGSNPNLKAFHFKVVP